MKAKKPKKRDHALETMLRDEEQYRRLHQETAEQKARKRKQKRP